MRDITNCQRPQEGLRFGTSAKAMLQTMITTFFIYSLASFCYAQTASDSISLSVSYGSRDNEFMEFLQFMNIDKYTVSLSDSSIKGKIAHIRLREFTNGKVTRVEDFLEKKKYAPLYMFDKEDSIFQFRVWTRKALTDTLQIFFRFKRHSVTKKFKVLGSNDYSLRSPIETPDVPRIPKSTFTPFLVYSLPYVDPERPGYLQYCKLTADGISPEKWGEVFKIPHYILMEIKFE